MTAVQHVEQLLEGARQQLGAGSCTIYVADPYWPNEYRLVCMLGVRYPESMHGFITPDPRTRHRVCEGPNEVFCTEPGDDVVKNLPDSISPDKRQLFWISLRGSKLKAMRELEAVHRTVRLTRSCLLTSATRQYAMKNWQAKSRP
jgi:hypothetical protein